MTLPRTCCAECGAPLRLQRIARDVDGEIIAPLSEREMEVLTLYARGLKPTDIAEELEIDPRTVGTYRTRLLIKLGVTTTRDLIVLGLRLGLCE